MMQNKMLKGPLIKRLLGQGQKQISHSDSALFVAESLGYLLNARRGMVMGAVNYGLPDFSLLTHAPSQLLRVMERQIFEVLQCYEPRLQQVRVQGHLDAEFPERMYFSIQGNLAWQQDLHRVSYQSMLLPGGRVMVKAA